MSKVIVIGGGPAGLMAALTAKKNKHDVILIEKNNAIGKKLDITGKGRCNITYKGNNQDFLDNVVGNSKFLISSINSFNNEDLLDFLGKLNVETKLERGKRYFLKSDKASELSNKLYETIKKEKIKVILNASVKDIEVQNDKVIGVKLADGKRIACDACVIATGGKSYPATGSTGDGYLLAERLGHSTTTILPALVPIKCHEANMCKSLQGLTLKNVEIKIIDVDAPKKIIYNAFGEMLFTNVGITGPIVLSASSKINRINNINDRMQNRKIKCIIDLKPALSYEQLYKRISRDFDKNINKEYKNSLNDLLPKSMIPVIIEKSEIEENKKVNQITKEEKQRLTNLMKNLEIYLHSLYKIEAGIVTAGGVNVKEINPKTMQSKIVKGLHFAGEVIDVDAYTGGYNLQIAFSTGYAAGSNIE